ncbi:MAG: hypothetical protein JW995_15830 [Melioribacteraceae bacterium]|nr:hypothetical protein [Melioribacteraceae bacterium]
MDDKQKIEWFDKAVKFQIEGMIFLTMKSRKNGVGSWAIENLKNNKVLNSNMEWEDEVPKSKRDEAYLIRTRFDFDSAMAMYEQYKMFSDELA